MPFRVPFERLPYFELNPPFVVALFDVVVVVDESRPYLEELG